MNHLQELFLDLVQIDGPSLQERKVADFVKDYLTGFDCPVMEDNAGSVIGGNCGNIVARLDGGPTGDGIILVSHLDTIKGTADLVYRLSPSRIDVDRGSILGADDRAGVAIMLDLVRRIREEGIRTKPVEFVFTVAEEIGLLGIRHLDFNLLGGRKAIVLDGDGPAGVVVNQAPTMERFRVEVKGRSAHAGVEPEKGINAIAIASKAISDITQGRLDDETTLNIGKIKGGDATNIVPELVEVEGECRGFSEGRITEVIGAVKRSFEKEAETMRGEIKFRCERCFTGFRIEGKFLNDLKEVFEGMGIRVSIKASGGGSDANVLNENGIETVVLGCGVFNPHSEREYVVSSDMKVVEDMLLQYIRLD